MDYKNLLHDKTVASLKKRLDEMEARENNLLAENHLLKQLYDQASLSCQSLDENDCFLSINQAWLDVLGYSQDEVTGEKFCEFLHPDWKDHFGETFFQLKATGEVHGLEFKMRKKDGGFIFVSFSGRIVKDPQGNFQQTCCIFQEITQQKELEEALIRSKEKWRNIIVSMPQLGISLNPQGRITFVNHYFTHMIGWNEQDIINQDWFDMFIPISIREEERKVFLAGLEQNNLLGFSTNENEIITRTGQVRKVVWSNVVSRDIHGGIIEVTCLGVDLTEQKQAVEQLCESQELVERIINTIPWRVFWKDINLFYMGCNSTFARDAGFDDPIHLIGKDDFVMSWHDQAELYRDDDRQVIESGSPKLFIEEPQTTAQGDTIYLLTSKVPLRNAKGEISGVLGAYIDITERKQIEEENKKLHTQLIHAQKMEAIGQLAAGIAHEINTPSQYLGSNINFLNDSFKEIIMLINQYDQLIQSEAEKLGADNAFINQFAAIREQSDWEYFKKEIPGALDQSIDGLAKISSIVLAMKEFSHPGHKDKQPIDLNRLIETTLIITHNEWKYVAEIEKQFDRHLPLVLCLPNDMGQVFLNIIVNASHAITAKIGDHPEVEKGRIVISSRALEDKVENTFTDSGGGISLKDKDKIFDPFFTTKEVGRVTGQGLTIAYDIIVNKHGGSIECNSIEGEGTTFTIHLPKHCGGR